MNIDYLYVFTYVTYFHVAYRECDVFQGNFHDFQHMTSWYGSKVLYFGDHVYTDLAVSMPPSLTYTYLHTHASLNIYSHNYR